MPRILIADGAPAADAARLAPFGGANNRELFETALRLHRPDARCLTINIADGENLPAGTALVDFDGVILTGSPLNAYDPVPAVTRQIDFARAAFGSGVPVWGSCWGLQVMAVALGGTVRLNPAGRELGIARTILLSPEAHDHWACAGRPGAFDALCSHEDEVEAVPEGGRVLAGNGVSRVQALEVERDGCSFLGVQYHPEHTFGFTAALVDRDRASLVRNGYARSEPELDGLVGDLRALHADPARRDLAWRHGLDRQVLDPVLRSQEIGRWLDCKVAGHAARRAAA